MTRQALYTGLILLGTSLAIFFWKVFVLDTPLRPSNPSDLWQVEFQLSARGKSERGSLRASLPATDEGQVIFDERSAADGLSFTIRDKQGTRTGIWSGVLTGVHNVVYGFRVKLGHVDIPLEGIGNTPPPADIVAAYLGDSLEFPRSEPDVVEALGRLGLPNQSDVIGRVRSITAFVVEEFAAVDTASQDALLTLARGEGSVLGKTRLLATLLRAAGVPARVTTGLTLKESEPPENTLFVEAWLDDKWLPISPVGAFFGSRPGDLLVLKKGDGSWLESTGVVASGHQIRARRERLRPEELATIMTPASPWLASVSLYRLPLSTQEALRLLLLLPLGALLVATWRNLIGILTYGTFLPVLLSLALRTTSLVLGLFLVFVVLGVGISGRIFVDRLRLLVVPRLGILMCLVVLTMTALALVGERFSERELFAGVVFPVVILTMLIERFSLTLAEEGTANALRKTGSTLLVAIAMYPVLRSELASHLMFGFPELVVGIMGLLTLLGGYTGYRLVDFRRFRSFLRAGKAEPTR